MLHGEISSSKKLAWWILGGENPDNQKTRCWDNWILVQCEDQSVPPAVGGRGQCGPLGKVGLMKLVEVRVEKKVSKEGNWWWMLSIVLLKVETAGVRLFRCLLWSWVLFFYFGILLVLIIDIFVDVHSNHCTCDCSWLFSLQLLRSFLFREDLISSDLCSPWQISMASQLGITFKLPLFWISLNLPQTIPKSCSWAILMCNSYLYETM